MKVFENIIPAVLANTQGYTDCMITLQRSINFILEQPELQMFEDRLKVIEVNFYQNLLIAFDLRFVITIHIYLKLC